MKNGQARGSHLTRCQSPSPDLDLPLTKRKSHFTSSLKCCNLMTRLFFTRTQTSAKDVSTPHCPVGLPSTIPTGSSDPKGQRPNQKVWRRSKSWVAHQSRSIQEGKLSSNTISYCPVLGTGCPCPNKVFCQHASYPHQI